MARAWSLTWVVLLLGLVLAGCSGPSEPADGSAAAAGPAEFDETQGAIAGRVLDEEGLPIAGAQVALVGLAASGAVTDAAGAFTLNRITPGEYTLAAQRLGYASAAQRIEVRAGEVADVQIVLAVIAIAEPWAEPLNHNGVVDTHVAFGRSVQPLNVGGNEDNWFMFGGFPDDFAGIMVEARWDETDFLAFDLVSRADDGGGVWYRTRSQSPLAYLALPCGDYRGEPTYGRVVMPCTPEEFGKTQGDGSGSAHLETFYAGQFQNEAHALDPVCRTGTPYWPAYEAGCYGVGVALELRWETWVTIFHMELPPDVDRYTAFADA